MITQSIRAETETNSQLHGMQPGKGGVMRHNVIVDCDPGHDDALALLLACHLAEVVGVTTVSGNAPVVDVTRNALAVIELIGADTAVHMGAAGPLLKDSAGVPRHATHVHGADGLGGCDLPLPDRAPASEDAVGYLLEASRLHPQSWLIAIGPLTNVALALGRDPEFADRLAGISIMGGSTVGGNVTATAEFNVWADPEAADVVFRSDARIRLCGLNLTRQLKTSAATLDTLAGIATPRSRFAAGLVGYLHERMETLTGEARAALHDPCAVLAVTHPELFEFRRRSVAVELNGRLTRGMTVIDERYSSWKSAPQIEVAYHIDADAAFALLFESVAR
jgi:inosine-uridine nucleoside N-ribohydrolase